MMSSFGRPRHLVAMFGRFDRCGASEASKGVRCGQMEVQTDWPAPQPRAVEATCSKSTRPIANRSWSCQDEFPELVDSSTSFVLIFLTRRIPQAPSKPFPATRAARTSSQLSIL